MLLYFYLNKTLNSKSLLVFDCFCTGVGYCYFVRIHDIVLIDHLMSLVLCLFKTHRHLPGLEYAAFMVQQKLKVSCFIKLKPFKRLLTLGVSGQFTHG